MINSFSIPIYVHGFISIPAASDRKDLTLVLLTAKDQLDE